MALHSKKRDLLSSRRRVEDKGEDEEGIEDLADDSQSEASILTLDDDGNAGGSDLSDNAGSQKGPSSRSVPNGHSGKPPDSRDQYGTAEATAVNGEPAQTVGSSGFAQTADMEAMVNGLKIEQTSANEEVLEFEDTVASSTAVNTLDDTQAMPAAQRRVEGADLGRPLPRSGPRKPRVTPNGDVSGRLASSRSAAQLQAGAPQPPNFVQGRVNPKTPAMTGNDPSQRSVPPHTQTNNMKWSHDLHDTVQETVPATERKANVRPQPPPSAPKVAPKPTLSKTVAMGNVAARIFLPSMEEARILDKKITIRQHTRLPDLRPPLRRDKAVRISIPDHNPRYVFPSLDRSFVFIPRAQRPNQQAKMRRGGYSSRGGSRRTSMQGSVYSPSAAMSRRSSFMGNGMMSPTGSMMGRPPLGAPTGPSRPVVRMPPGHFAGMPFQAGAGAVDMSYPLPTEPARREHRSSQMTMHQPRPQKQMSVASIEGEQQPFHQQLPPNTGIQEARAASSAVRYPGQSQMGTPLHNIPESAINAQPFQPGNAPSQPYFYPMQAPMYYYPGPNQQQQPPPYPYPQMASPLYLQPAPYYMPMLMPMQNPGEEGDPNTYYMQGNDGITYYYPSSQLQNGEQGAPPMMSPAPEGYYHQEQPQA